MANLERKNPYFTEFENEYFNSENITAVIVDSGRSPLSNVIRNDLNKKWDLLPGKKWPNDTNPSRFRYEGHKVQDGKIILMVSPSVSYKDYAAWDQNFTIQYGIDSAPLPISVTTLIETTDHKLVLTKRKPEADYKAGGLSGVGGFMEIKKDAKPNGTPDILGALKREANEETGLESNELNISSLNSIIYNPISGSVDLVFWSKTSLSTIKLARREHDEENTLVFADMNPDSLQNLVLTRTNAFTVGVLGLLIAKGSEMFGKKWADETLGIFRLRGISYSEAVKRGPNLLRKLELKDSNK